MNVFEMHRGDLYLTPVAIQYRDDFALHRYTAESTIADQGERITLLGLPRKSLISTALLQSNNLLVVIFYRFNHRRQIARPIFGIPFNVDRTRELLVF